MKTKLPLLGALLALCCATAQAQLTITTNMVPPVLGPYDQYYLPGPVDEATGAMTTTGAANGNSAANDSLTYVAFDQRSKGQSFTTGPNPMGYTISAVTVRHILWTNFLANGTFMNIPSGQSFDFRFGTLSGANITPILTTTATYTNPALNMAGGTGTGIYFTFDLSAAGVPTLSPDTTYFFEIASEATAYFELHNTASNATSYTNGTAFSGDTTAALTQGGVVNLPPFGGEFAFVASLSAVGAPSIVATVNPGVALHGQSLTVTATVTPGVGTVTNVSVDLSAIGGSPAAGLVLSNANVYTNTFIVPVGAPVGGATLVVTAKDTTPLVGTYGISFTVLPSDCIWNGGSLAGNNWTDTNNWQNGFAPIPSAGNNAWFAGSTRLFPDMDTNYNVTLLMFSNTAASFNIGSSSGRTLTIDGGGLENDSASPQTLNVPVVTGSPQTFNTAAGDVTFSNAVTGSSALIKAGPGTLTFAGTNASVIGDFQVTNGLVEVTGNLTVRGTSGNLTRLNGGNLDVAVGGLLVITNPGVWFPVGDSATGSSSLTISGGTMMVVDNFGMEVPRQGTATLTINSGSLTVNDTLGVGLIIGDQGTAVSGTVNLNGGTLMVNRITANNGTASFSFNGGTLKPAVGNGANFFPLSGALTAYLRNGGAIIDTAGFDVTIGQSLQHSPLGGDNAMDGGLTKTGNGTLTLAGGYGYTGPNRVLAGTLNLNLGFGAAGSGGDLVVSNATLMLDASSGVTMPAANVTIYAGSVLTFTESAFANVINGTGSLLIQSNCVFNLNYGALGGANPTAAAVNAGGSISVTGTNNVINLSGTGFVIGQFPLLKYASGTLPSISGFTLGTLPPGVKATLVNNTANQSVDLNITLAGQLLTWYGADSLGNILANWDLTSSNWNNGTKRFVEYVGNTLGDLVTFDDTLYNNGINPPVTNVNLTTTLVPSQITENSSLLYTLSGPGSIAGAGSVVMNGLGSLTLGTANSYTGGTFVNSGTLVINSEPALGASSSVLTMSSNCTLQIAGNMANPHSTTLAGAASATTGAGSVIVDTLPGMTAQLLMNPSSGAGLIVQDQGTLILSGTNNFAYFFEGNSTLGGNLVITNGSFIISQNNGNSKFDLGANVTLANGGLLAVRAAANAWFPFGDTAGTTNTMTIAGGTFIVTNNFGIEAPRQGNAILTINSGSMVVNDSAAVGLILGDQATAESGTLSLNGGSLTVNRITSGNGTNVFYLNGGTLKPALNNGGAFFPNSTHLATFVRNAGVIVDTAGFNVSIAQPLLHSVLAGDNATDGGLTKNGNGRLRLNGVGTYTGPTVVNGGTLGGLGTIAGTLAVNANATFNPGNGGASDKITVNGNITFASGSTNLFSVNGTTPATTSVAAGAGVTYGGVLSIAANGTFAPGQQFQLFSGAGATNASNFASIISSPGSGLAFSFTNGVLSVVQAGPTGPAQLTNSFAGGTLSLSWPAGQGWRLQMQTNGLLNTNWVYVTDGTINSTNIPVDTSKPSTFYRLKYP